MRGTRVVSGACRAGSGIRTLKLPQQHMKPVPLFGLARAFLLFPSSPTSEGQSLWAVHVQLSVRK